MEYLKTPESINFRWGSTPALDTGFNSAANDKQNIKDNFRSIFSPNLGTPDLGGMARNHGFFQGSTGFTPNIGAFPSPYLGGSGNNAHFPGSGGFDDKHVSFMNNTNTPAAPSLLYTSAPPPHNSNSHAAHQLPFPSPITTSGNNKIQTPALLRWLEDHPDHKLTDDLYDPHKYPSGPIGSTPFFPGNLSSSPWAAPYRNAAKEHVAKEFLSMTIGYDEKDSFRDMDHHHLQTEKKAQAQKPSATATANNPYQSKVAANSKSASNSKNKKVQISDHKVKEEPKERPIQKSGSKLTRPSVSGTGSPQQQQQASHPPLPASYNYSGYRQPPSGPPVTGKAQNGKNGKVAPPILMHMHSCTYETEFKRKTREAALFRFKQKKKERKYEKVIRYSCRKQLADSRPRVKGRFVKMD